MDNDKLTNRWYMVSPTQPTKNWACTCDVKANFEDDKAMCPKCRRQWSLKG
jgi:hypothetical protein